MEKYPECIISDPSSLSNGICDVGEANSEKCGWDGGDCVIEAYPDCHVPNPSKIGNGFCDDEYNIEICQWDGGDCVFEGRRPVETIGIVFGAIAVTALILLSQLLFIRTRNRYSNVVANTRQTPSRAPPDPNFITSIASRALFGLDQNNSMRTDRVKREERLAFVKSTIIRKKVLLKSTRQDDEVLLLFNDKVIAFHPSKKNTDNGTSQISSSSQHSMMKCDDESLNELDEESRGRMEKGNIYIDSTSMQSSLCNVTADKSLNSIRRCLNMTASSKQAESIYSSRSCPVCCEDYEKGDDIAWSRNEDCVHAFHFKCIVEWLVENDDCPMCRSDYLKVGDSSNFPIALPADLPQNSL